MLVLLVPSQTQDSKPLLPPAAVPAGIAAQMQQAGDFKEEAELLLRQQQVKAVNKEEKAEKALAK